jgi:hypothetical protein
MWEITKRIQHSLSGILVAIFRSIFKDVLFPRKRRSPEDETISRLKALNLQVRSQADQIARQAILIAERERALRDRDDLLAQKNKEIKTLEYEISSLELQLEETHHSRAHVY